MKYYDEKTGKLFNTIAEYDADQKRQEDEKKRKEELQATKAKRWEEIQNKNRELTDLIRKYNADYKCSYTSLPLNLDALLETALGLNPRRRNPMC